MEFSRRGPATDGAAGSHHRPDPPPPGDAMLMMRDALLWQLQKDRLRQEIILAELTKIECAMALHAASSIRTMPVPWDSMPQCKEPVFNWESKHQGDLGEGHDGKLPKNDGRQSAESRFWKPVVEDCADECSNPSYCKCNVDQENATFDVLEPELGGSDEAVLSNKSSQAVKWELTGITIPVKKPKRPMKWSCDLCQEQVSIKKVIRQHCAGKKHRSNIAILESRIKAIGGHKAKQAAEPSPGTGQIKISSIRWSCSSCQATGTCQSDLEEHIKGTKHQQSIAVSCEEGSDNVMAKSIAPHEAKLHESDVTRHAEKLPLVGCNICQVVCGRESDLEIHLKGRRHLNKIRTLLEESKNITALCKECSNNDVAKDIAPHVAKSHESNVPRNAEKAPLARCSICQAIFVRKSDLETHLKTKRHLKKIQALLEESKNKALISEPHTADLNLDSVPQHVENTNCELDSESLRDERHQPNVQALGEKINQEKSNPPEIAGQIPSSAWDCAMCEAKCSSKAQFEHHCTSRKHRRKINVTLGEGNITKLSSLHIEVPCKEGSNSDMVKNIASQEAKSHESNVPGNAEKPPLVGCSICQVICGRESDLEIHVKGKRHLKEIRALVEVPCKEGSNNGMVKNIASQEAKSHESDVPGNAEKPPLVGCSICQVICGRKSDLEIHVKGKRHLKEIRALLEESKNKAMEYESQKANLNLDSVPQPVEIANCELDMESHLREERLHVMNDLHEKLNKDKNNPPELAKDQSPSSVWDCTMCQAKCNSKAQFENHCLSRKHQRKTQVIMDELLE